jgi:hypothetical protein
MIAERLCACGCGKVIKQEKQSKHSYPPRLYFDNACRIRDFGKKRTRNNDYLFD